MPRVYRQHPSYIGAVRSQVASAVIYRTVAGSLALEGEVAGRAIAYFGRDRVGNLVVRDLRVTGGLTGFSLGTAIEQLRNRRCSQARIGGLH
jgi:hypothetical protein